MDSIKRDYKEILIAILIMGVVSMVIVYANFTRRLQIVNTAHINNTKWDIHFENLVKKSSTAQVISEPKISNSRTIISGLNVRLNKPGDYVTYTFDIVNAGDINAKLYDFNRSNPICEPSSAICDSIIYSLKYTDGTAIKVSDKLRVNERRNVTMTVKLNDSVSSMPNAVINVKNLNAVFDYVQD